MVRDHQLWIELFVLFNFAGLIADIFLAHSENQFRRRVRIRAAVLLGGRAVVRSRAYWRASGGRWPAVWRDVGHLVGWLSVVVGLAGVVLHLDSQFFYERTLRSLTYAAPFAAPLAYTGLGLLLIVNRMVASESPEWARWMLLLALGGFIGNFVFSLTDHAMNGFFNAVEWIPVVSSAFAIGFLIVPFVVDGGRPYLCGCAAVLGVQAVVGVTGFGFHARADLAPARRLVVRADPERRAADGAAAVPEPRRARVDCAVGAEPAARPSLVYDVTRMTKGRRR